MNNNIVDQLIITKLQTVYDSDIPVNIYDMGYVYGVEIKNSNVNIKLTMASPMESKIKIITEEIRKKVGSINGINSVEVNMVFQPAWSETMMKQNAKQILGVF